MDRVLTDLSAYYEEEARLRLRKPLVGRRVGLRDEFLGLLAGEGRRSVLDLGAGPGGDALAFRDAGYLSVGLDLAIGNARLAAEHGLTVVPAAIAAPPLRPGSFDAGWSMSVLMHVPDEELEATAAAMVVPLVGGAPLLVGLWGGERRDIIEEGRIGGRRRLFSLRPLERNREALASCGDVERTWRWEPGTDGQEYHAFLVRVR